MDPRHNVVQSIIGNISIVAVALLVLVLSMVITFFRGKGFGRFYRNIAEREKGQQSVELMQSIQSFATCIEAAEADYMPPAIGAPITNPHIINVTSAHDVDDDLVIAENARARALINGSHTINSNGNHNTGEGGGLVVANLSKRFPGAMRRRALNDVSLVVAPRELMVLLGPNGAGKSTFMNVLTGDIALQSGDAGRAPQQREKEGAFTRGHVRVSGVNIAQSGSVVSSIFSWMSLSSTVSFCLHIHASIFEAWGQLQQVT